MAAEMSVSNECPSERSWSTRLPQRIDSLAKHSLSLVKRVDPMACSTPRTRSRGLLQLVFAWKRKVLRPFWRWNHVNGSDTPHEGPRSKSLG
jgi:hypothetical protein